MVITELESRNVSSLQHHKPPTSESLRNRYVAAIPLFMRKYLDKITRLGYPNYYKASGICFIHIPKNAGTSIALALYGRKIEHLSAQFLQKANPAHFERSLKLAVLREPGDRLLSAYNFIKNKGTSLVPIADLESYKEPDFQSFDLFLSSWLPRHIHGELDAVFRDQSSFICNSKGDLLVENVFLMEDVELLSEFLSLHIGNKIIIPTLNVGAEYAKVVPTETAKLLEKTIATYFAADKALYEKTYASRIKHTRLD